MKEHRPTRRRATPRGFSLLETLAVVVTLAVAVPPVLSTLGDASVARRDGATAMRASTLACAALETILADVRAGSAALGYDALADSDAYLNTPGTGLMDRLKPFLDTVAVYGIGCSVVISDVVDESGAQTGDPDEDVCRDVTVVVTFPAVRSGVEEMRVSMRVGAP